MEGVAGVSSEPAASQLTRIFLSLMADFSVESSYRDVIRWSWRTVTSNVPPK